MRCFKPIFVVALLFIWGCAANPRYRTGGAEQLAASPTVTHGLTTNEYLRFGTVLQGYLGKPYKGKSMFISGVDCSLFAQEVFKKYNSTELPRTVARQFQIGRVVSYRQLSFGDLVFFRTEGRQVSHIGIYVGEGKFIHASTSRGVIVDNLVDKYWAERFVGARRVLN